MPTTFESPSTLRFPSRRASFAASLKGKYSKINFYVSIGNKKPRRLNFYLL